jgi:DNA-binding LacI/PurR family transcriptional regulator
LSLQWVCFKIAGVNPLPSRTSLTGQAADALRAAIADGVWECLLPGEMELVERLRVGRNTLRVALAQLEREGVLTSGQGKRREIRRNKIPQKRRVVSSRVVLLSPEPIHRQRFSTVLWMDELRDHLASAGYVLDVQASLAAWRRRPGPGLEEIASRLAPAAWILHRSTAQMQQWFSARALPCLVAGTRHEGVALPSVDMNHRAVGRHAASRLVARGRRELAMLHMASALAGDAETAAGFREGAGSAMVRDIIHNGTPAGVCAALDHALKTAHPDGLFVFHTTHTLTALGHLTQAGIRIPADLSLICREEEPMLAHAIPEPARYSLSATAFARKVSRLVRDILASSATKPRQHWMMPEFVARKTL